MYEYTFFTVNKSINKYVLEEIKNLYKNNQLNQKCSKLGEGDSSIVYEYKQFAIKVFREKTKENKDYIVLSQLQNSSYFLKLYAYIPEKLMITEKVRGNSLFQLATNGIEFQTKWKRQIEDIFEICKSNNIEINDLHLNNCMVVNNRLKIIDVGSFTITENRKINYDISKIIESYNFVLNFNEPEDYEEEMIGNDDIDIQYMH